MALQDLAPELIHHLYNSLSTVSDVLNLACTCRKLYQLLPHARKLTTIFAAADKEFGPLEDVIQLITYNASQPVHILRSVQYSYPLLRQIISAGRIAHKIEEIYPTKRWQEDYLNRRALSDREKRCVRRAVYRYWLYCEAFHNRRTLRSQRLLPQIIAERSKLLRSWTTPELLEIEDLRVVLEDLVASDLCPTDGVVARTLIVDTFAFQDYPYRQKYSSNSWPSNRYSCNAYTTSLFHDSREGHYSAQDRPHDLPIMERRKLEMSGWGDEIAQYYIVQSMLKLNPAQIMQLHETVTNRIQVELFVAGLDEEWFWNNGQTFLDTWNVVLNQRGFDHREMRESILQGKAGIVSDAASF